MISNIKITLKEWLIQHISTNPNINYSELVKTADLLGFYKQANFVGEVTTLIKDGTIIKMNRSIETCFKISKQVERDNKINEILNIN